MKPINRHFLPLLLLTLMTSVITQVVMADDLVCIRCVDTTDINYDAVTSNRILDGTIRTSDIGLDAVTSSRIRAGEVRTSDLAPNAVTTSRIMNGAVTEAKLAQELGAERSVSGHVFKVSTLILHITLAVRDADSGRLLGQKSVSIRGNTDESWQHGLKYLLKTQILTSATK